MSPAPRIAALVKQIPAFEQMTLGPDGRLVRDGIELEMNPYCRRAVAKAVALAEETGGEAVVLTMGPPSAEDSLREAIACGSHRGVLLTDRALAGSDTLATARAIRALLQQQGGFDLVLVGKNSVDADTGQVGPELAELLDWTFAGPVKELDVDFDNGTFRASCETDDGFRVVEGELPAVLAAAERLIGPAKAFQDLRDEVDPSLIATVTTAELDGDEWGAEASPTYVGPTRTVEVGRKPVLLGGTVDEQVRQAVDILAERGVLDPAGDRAERYGTESPAHHEPGAGPEVWAVVEPARERMALELGHEALRLARETDGTARVVSLGAALDQVPRGVSGLTVLEGDPTVADADHARVLTALVGEALPWALLFPSTSTGREIVSRVCAALELGLTGDAVELDVQGEQLVAWKPAFGGQLVAAILSRSDVQAVTVRAGVLDFDEAAPMVAPELTVVPVRGDGRLRVVEGAVEDDLEAMAVAPVVIGVGMGVDPSEYESLEPLRKLLDGELGATRKVTDRGWLPRCRQIGITGRAIAPRLFVSIGASGKFNHSVGVRAAGTVLTVNPDVEAPMFQFSDIGIVGDWREVVPLLEAEIRRRQA